MAEETRGAVLLVDDDRALLRILGMLLRKLGFEVTTAEQGTEAAQLARTQAFDVIVSDINMPDMDGLQLLRAVREQDLDVPVILMTGNPGLETAMQAVELGATRYVPKPVPEPVLREAVEHAVRLHRMARLKREALALLGSQDRLVGDRAGLEGAFEAALDALAMAYQPIVRADGSRYGFEALLRGRTAALSTPQALLDAAERLGQVERLGRRVRALVAESLLADGQVAFVNLHPEDLADPELSDPLAPLSRHAAKVVLEVTERATLDRVTGLRGRVARLRELGYRIALDDLGAGYAGLSSLAALTPEVIKLDMSLVRGIDLDPVKRKLVASMVGVGHELGALVLAEGVETPEEREALAGLGCDLLQGFLFGRPELAGRAA